MRVFLELSGKQLTDYLSVRGVAWILLGGEKWNWLLRAFLLVAAMELKLDIIQSSSENQSNLSQSNFEKKKKVKEPWVPDLKTVRENAVENVTKWPQVTLGVGTY